MFDPETNLPVAAVANANVSSGDAAPNLALLQTVNPTNGAGSISTTGIVLLGVIGLAILAVLTFKDT